jgi:hypothetical protein
VAQGHQVVAEDDVDVTGAQCFIDHSKLVISRLEILSVRPLVVFFHDVLTDQDVDQIRQLAEPDLEAPKTVSARSGSVKSSATKRSGKVAFITGHFESDERVRKQMRYAL